MPVFGKPPQVVVDLFEHAGQICVLEPVPLRFDPGGIWSEGRGSEVLPSPRSMSSSP
jgi:hypothetical protein